MEYVAGRGTTGMSIAGLTTGIIGTVGALGGLAAAHTTPVNGYVTKDELNYVQQIAAKDAQLSLMQSENDAEKKMVEVYTALAKQDKDIRADLNAFKDIQYGVNAAQGVANAQMAASIAAVQASVAGLQQITKVVVPNTSVCPGWGDVTIKPAG